MARRTGSAVPNFMMLGGYLKISRPKKTKICHKISKVANFFAPQGRIPHPILVKFTCYMRLACLRNTLKFGAIWFINEKFVGTKLRWIIFPQIFGAPYFIYLFIYLLYMKPMHNELKTLTNVTKLNNTSIIVSPPITLCYLPCWLLYLAAWSWYSFYHFTQKNYRVGSFLTTHSMARIQKLKFSLSACNRYIRSAPVSPSWNDVCISSCFFVIRRGSRGH